MTEPPEAEDGWEVLHVLPGLVLPPQPAEDQHGEWPQGLDLGTDFVTIVAPSDPRAQTALAGSTRAKRALASFRRFSGEAYEPSVLLMRASAPESVQREAVVAFRNSVALAFILKGRTAWIGGDSSLGPVWADTFKFHPLRIASDGIWMVSPGVRHLVAMEKPLTLTHSLAAPLAGGRLFADLHLYRALGVEWERAFARPEGADSYALSLFRSLEVAFAACGVPEWNEGSVHDFGLQIALWISAIEILAWPATQHADFSRVLELLKNYPLRPALSERRFPHGRDELNPLGQVCRQLYDARNSFLHGNPVSLKSLLGSEEGEPVPLFQIAAVVYRMALVAYLSERHPLGGADPPDLDRDGCGLMGEFDYEEALAKALRIEV